MEQRDLAEDRRVADAVVSWIVRERDAQVQAAQLEAFRDAAESPHRFVSLLERIAVGSMLDSRPVTIPTHIIAALLGEDEAWTRMRRVFFIVLERLAGSSDWLVCPEECASP